MTLKPKTTTTLKDAIADIERDFGAGSIMLLGSQPQKVEAIPTGSLRLDTALGIGGLPRGRIAEIFGAPAVGKSTLVLSTIAEAQKLGTCALLDSEHALDPAYAKAIGVDLGTLVLAQPQTSEETWELAQRLVKSGEIVLLAIDSLASLLPRAELMGEAGEAHVGLKARQIGQGLRRLVPAAKAGNTAILLVNQTRESIGITYGSPVVVPGGKAPKFTSTVRIELKRGELAKRTSAPPHKQKVKFKIVKNKLAAPYRESECWLEYGIGFKELRNADR